MLAGKELSVFDVIGPAMIGPSSSHTAGALRIARMAAKMVKHSILEVKFVLYGSFAQTYGGHGTDRALVAGILGFNTEDYRIKESFRYAREAGLLYSFEVNAASSVAHPNTVDIIITDNTYEVTSITGISVGGGNVLIKRINGVEIDLTGEYHTLVVHHKDMPGTVAYITHILSEYDINIAFMKLYRENKGTDAYSIIEADQVILEDIIDKIEESSNVLRAFIIAKET